MKWVRVKALHLGLADSVRPVLSDGGLDVPDAAQGTTKPHIHVFLLSCLSYMSVSVCLSVYLSVCLSVCLTVFNSR